MPETQVQSTPATVAPTVTSLIEQYELPDEEFAETATEQPQAAAEESPAPQPRNPDGTFAPPVAKPAAPAHSKLALKMADYFGISPEEAAQMAPDALEQTVEALHRQSLHGTARRESSEQPAQQPAAKPAEPADPLQGLDMADWHPGIRDAFTSLSKRLQDAEARLGEVHSVQQATIQETRNQRLDRLFATHCDPSLTGEGNGADMDKESPEFLRRVALIELAKRQTGNDAQKFKKAADILRLSKAGTTAPAPATPAPAATPRPANGRITPEEWNEAGTARPTHRNGAAEPKGDGAAAAAVQAAMRAKGFNTRIEGPDEELDLPD